MFFYCIQFPFHIIAADKKKSGTEQKTFADSIWCQNVTNGFINGGKHERSH